MSIEDDYLNSLEYEESLETAAHEAPPWRGKVIRGKTKPANTAYSHIRPIGTCAEASRRKRLNKEASSINARNCKEARAKAHRTVCNQVSGLTASIDAAGFKDTDPYNWSFADSIHASHHIQAVGTHHDAMFCKRCGYWNAGGPLRKLKDACPSFVSAPRAYQHGLLTKGIIPRGVAKRPLSPTPLATPGFDKRRCDVKLGTFTCTDTAFSVASWGSTHHRQADAECDQTANEPSSDAESFDSQEAVTRWIDSGAASSTAPAKVWLSPSPGTIQQTEASAAATQPPPADSTEATERPLTDFICKQGDGSLPHIVCKPVAYVTTKPKPFTVKRSGKCFSLREIKAAKDTGRRTQHNLS